MLLTPNYIFHLVNISEPYPGSYTRSFAPKVGTKPAVYMDCLFHVDIQGKGGVVLMESVNAYIGSGGFVPLILNLNTRWK